MATPPAQGQGSPFGPRFVLPLALGTMLNPINSTMISTALAPIAMDFHATVAETAWLITGLYLTSAVAQPTMGRLTDLFGPRRIYLASLLLVALAGLGGVLAPTLGALVAVRVLLGIGTAGAYPSAMRAFRSRADGLGMTPPRLALGALAISSVATQTVGPTLGGFMTSAFGWHAIFAINVPFALLIALLVLLGVPKDPAVRRVSLRQLTQDIDATGIVLFAAALLTLMIFLMNRNLALWPLLPVSAVAWLLFWRHSMRLERPFIDVRMLAANRPLAITLMRVLLFSLVPYCVLYGFAQWLQTSAHYSPGAAGLMTLPMSIASAASSLLGARMKSIRAPFILGAISGLTGCVGLAFLTSGSAPWFAAAAVTFAGLPVGLIATATQTAIFIQSPPASIGVAAGLQRSFMNFGAIAAASILGLIFGAQPTDESFHTLSLVMIVLSGALLLFVLLDRTLPRGRVD